MDVSFIRNYGNINDYIEQFRNYIRQFNWDDETLTLLFYNGLHPNYQKEIDKAETFPVKLEDIITKCIIIINQAKRKIITVENRSIPRTIISIVTIITIKTSIKIIPVNTTTITVMTIIKL